MILKRLEQKRAANKTWYNKNKRHILEKAKEKYASAPKKVLTLEQMETKRLSTWRWRRNNPERVKAQSKAWFDSHPNYQTEWYIAHRKELITHRSSPNQRMGMLFNSVKERAKKGGQPYDEALLEVLRKSSPTHCTCCKVAFDYTRGEGRKKASPSLDRIDNMKPYTIENVAVICNRCNTLKSNGNIEDFENILAYMKERL